MDLLLNEAVVHAATESSVACSTTQEPPPSDDTLTESDESDEDFDVDSDENPSYDTVCHHSTQLYYLGKILLCVACIRIFITHQHGYDDA